MSSLNWKVVEHNLNDLINLDNSEKVSDYLSQCFPTIPTRRIDAMSKVINRDNIGDMLYFLGKPEGKTNGLMPTLLLAPHRILGPAFLGLGVLTIMILSMFAG